jgi:hypothetical protein
LKNPSPKRAGGVAEGVSLEVKPQYYKKIIMSKDRVGGLILLYIKTHYQAITKPFVVMAQRYIDMPIEKIEDIKPYPLMNGNFIYEAIAMQ